jgi:hypothetical protein
MTSDTILTRGFEERERERERENTRLRVEKMLGEKGMTMR